ncbi:MAG: glycosyltransferase family 39 protein [Candidatus Omnitrophota bacterium]
MAFLAVAALPLVLSWAQCALPPTGNDALAYHLAHSKQFVLDHRIGPLALTRESMWPYLTEMLFALGLAIEGTTLAQLFHWIFYGLTAWTIYLYGKRFYGAAAGRIASIVFLYTPVAYAQSSQAYVDLSLTFFVFLAFYVFMLMPKVGEGAAALICGFFAGAAASVKYLGLGCGAILLILWVLRAKKKWMTPLVYLIAFGLVAAVWYLRSWIALGNPVYPFFHLFFGGNGYDMKIAEGVGVGNGPLQFILLLWNMTMRPEPFGGDLVGPIYLLFVPLLLLRRRAKSEGMGKYFLVFTLLYGLFIFTQSQQTRFFLSVMPYLSLGVGVFLTARPDGPHLRYARIALLMSLVMIAGIFVYRFTPGWSVLSAKRSWEDYLQGTEHSFLGQKYLAGHLKAGQKALNGADVRIFYGPMDRMVYVEYPLKMYLIKNRISLQGYLDRERFDYFWLKKGNLPQLWNYAERGGYKEVYRYDFAEDKINSEYVILKK